MKKDEVKSDETKKDETAPSSDVKKDEVKSDDTKKDETKPSTDVKQDQTQPSSSAKIQGKAPIKGKYANTNEKTNPIAVIAGALGLALAGIAGVIGWKNTKNQMKMKALKTSILASAAILSLMAATSVHAEGRLSKVTKEVAAQETKSQ